MAFVVTTAGSPFEFETTLGQYMSRPIAIDTNHFAATWSGSGSDGYIGVFTVNTSTWAVTTSSTTLEFDTTIGQWHSLVQIDTNHFINFYAGSGSDGYAEVYTVNTTTWAVTTASTRLEFDTVLGQYNSAVKIDDNHFIDFYEGNGSDGFAQVFTVNTTTWAVTTSSARLEFDTQTGQWHSACKIDTNHFIDFWLGGAATVDGRVQVFTVNTSTWAVTTAASLLVFDTDVGSRNNAYQIDSNHFINFWQGSAGDGYAQVFTVNTSTWAVTTAGSQFEFETTDYLDTNGGNSIARIDTNHFLHLWAGPDTAASTAYDGFAQVFEVNTTTWAVTTAGSAFEYETTQGEWSTVSEVIAGTDKKFLAMYSGSGDDGFAQVLNVNQSPTVSLSSPADAGSTSDTTPDLVFTGTDANSDDIRYNIQVDTVNTFDSTSETYLFGKETMEGGSLPGSFDTNTTGGSATQVIDSTSKVTGTYSVKQGATGTGTAYLGETLGSDATEIWAKFSVFLPTGYSAGTTGYHTFWQATNNSDTDAGYLSLENYGTIRITANGDAIGYTDTSVDLSLNTVHTVQVYLKKSATVGRLKIWVDTSVEGSPSYDSGDKNTGTVAIRKVFFGKYYSPDANSDMYIDDFIIKSSFITGTSGPLIDKVSGTDSGFAGTPDNTDPFASGQAVTYTVQSALSVDTYYWRVRGIDPSGSNTYGDWSSTRSFDITGATNASVTQVYAAVTLSGGTQAVVGNVLANASITQVYASMSLTGGTQAVASVQNASIAQVYASLSLSGGTQAVATVRNVSIDQIYASLSLSGGTQVVASVQNASITQVAGSLSLSGGTQVVATVRNSAITQVAGSLAISGGTQAIATVRNVAITQVYGSISTTGGTQVVATVNNGIVSQVSASVLLTGGTQSLGSVINAAISQVSTSLSLSGGTQDISATQIASSNITQVSSSMSLAGGTQEVSSKQNAAVTQVYGTVSLAVGIQDVTIYTSTIVNATVAQVSASLSLAGGTQEVASSNSTIVYQEIASLALAGGDQQIATVNSAFITQVSAELELRGGTNNVKIRNLMLERDYYIDENGNYYRVISQTTGLVYKV